MTLNQWAANGWLKAQKTSPQEIRNLFSIVERDLKDSRGEISADWRLGIAYNAALKLGTILLRAEGYRPDRSSQHYRVIQAIPMILGDKYRNESEYLDACRIKRNTVEYDMAGAVTFSDAVELVEFVENFQSVVQEWIKANHPELE
jgi:hypothetical protein